MSVGRAVKDVFIVAAKRTPFGAMGGSLASYSATDLLEQVFKATLESGNVDPSAISSTCAGMVAQATKDSPYIARHAAIRAGIPLDRPAFTVNRLCGSGFQSVVNGIQEIAIGDSQVVLTGGSESMSLAPHASSNVKFGVKFMQDVVFEDRLWNALVDHQYNMPMGVTAENLAEKYDISRQQCDEFAFSSQQRWKAARDAGRFKEEMAPITIKTKKGEKVFDTDEHPKPETTLEKLGKLPAVFKKGGCTSAGNSSGICDGAGAVVIATEAACKQHNLTPLVRIAGYGVAGCEPSIMGIGPVPAIRSMLKATGVALGDIGLVEVNEAFAAQYLSVEKELGLNREITNTNGGAIAIGHPVGASGARIMAHLTHEMRRCGVKYALGSACIGGGQGISILMEKL